MPVPELWSDAIMGFILLAGLVTVVVLYHQAKASEGAEAGRKWGYLFVAVLVVLALLGLSSDLRHSLDSLPPR